jgi:hypothetical protein
MRTVKKIGDHDIIKYTLQSLGFCAEIADYTSDNYWGIRLLCDNSFSRIAALPQRNSIFF